MACVVACKDTGADCDAVLRAETMEELQKKIAAHAKEAHGMDIASIPEEQKQQLMSLIKQE
jgi:predicted small metal-binding protein